MTQTNLSPEYPGRFKALENLGIVREITGRQRNRIYAYQTLLDILNERSGPQKLDSAISASSGQAAILAADS